MRLLRPMLIGAGLAWGVVAPVAAAAPPRETAAVRSLAACRAEPDPAARLACYDKATDALVQAQAAGDVVVVDRAQVREVRRQAFGLHLPSLDLLPHAAHEAPLQRVEVELASAARGGDGRWLMVTQEGAQWAQTDSDEIYHPPHAGSRLRVRAGVLGSFFCSVDGQTAVRCQRRQ